MNTKAIIASTIVMLFLVSSFTMIVPAVSADDVTEDAGLPSSFDQRDLGIVTPPKFQNPWGTCWAFGGTGAAETAILTAMGKTYEETGMDLSERHVAYFSNTPVHPPISYEQDNEGVHTVSDDLNAMFDSGGWAFNYFQLFSTGVGPVMEEWYPYHGENGETMLDFYQDHDRAEAQVREDNKDLEEEIPEYTPEEREEVFNSWVKKGYKFPEGVNAENFTFDDFVEANIAYNLQRYQRVNEYSIYDDWTIDIEDRNYTMGYSMMDGCRMKEPRIMVDGSWKGVDWDAANDIKSELMKGHGLALGYGYDSKGYNNELGTQYHTGTGTNHMVQLVGWDDSIPKENFAYKVAEDLTFTPEGDGAWLCKNSWGSETYGFEVDGVTYYTSWGIKDEDGKHTGYFWLSYYDRSVTNVESMSFSDRLYDDNGYTYYIHDFLPDRYNYHWSYDERTIMANIFTSYGHTEITGISIYTRERGSDVKVKLYIDPKAGDPESGELVYEAELSYPYAGMHVIYPDETIEMWRGQRFSIVYEERAPDGKYVVGMNSLINEEYGTILYGISVINRGESLIYKDGWMDLLDVIEDYESEYPRVTMDNFSIKAFAIDHPSDNSNLTYVAIAIGLVLVEALALLFIRKR